MVVGAGRSLWNSRSRSARCSSPVSRLISKRPDLQQVCRLLVQGPHQGRRSQVTGRHTTGVDGGAVHDQTGRAEVLGSQRLLELQRAGGLVRAVSRGQAAPEYENTRFPGEVKVDRGAVPSGRELLP
jgi:hypothetical protein